MPTVRQKKVFKKMLENVSSEHPKPTSLILKEAGYNKIANQPNRIIDSKGFQELLAQINDNDILNKFYEILQADDKRASLQAGVELLKLKDRYPNKTNVAVSIFNKIDGLID